MPVSDTLREMLLNEESIHSHVYSTEEKQEFIFKIFTMLVIGGGLCQPEFKIDKYFDVTRSLYKELLVLYR